MSQEFRRGTEPVGLLHCLELQPKAWGLEASEGSLIPAQPVHVGWASSQRDGQENLGRCLRSLSLLG